MQKHGYGRSTIPNEIFVDFLFGLPANGDQIPVIARGIGGMSIRKRFQWEWLIFEETVIISHHLPPRQHRHEMVSLIKEGVEDRAARRSK
jgi:hypothetical protein